MMEQLNGKRAHFNSRLLTETNLSALLYMTAYPSFQFTSPYGDEQDKTSIAERITRISIHVSLRRRTAKRINMLDLYFLIEQPQQ